MQSAIELIPARPAPSLTAANLRCLLVLRSLTQEGQPVTSREIAACLQLTPPTVCRMLESLVQKGLIRKEPYGKAELTPHGRKTALLLQERVDRLQAISMRQLGLDREAALQTALFFACSLDKKNQLAILGSAHHHPKEETL